METRSESGLSAKVIEVTDTRVTIERTVELSRSMLETEEAIQVGWNEAGGSASQEAWRYVDTDGSPISIGPASWRTNGRQPKSYQTPSGEVERERPGYQRSGGGKTYGPLEHEARIVITSTPRFAKPVSSQFASGAGRDVQRDLAEHHARPGALSYRQRLSEAIAAVVQTKETDGEDALPEVEAAVARGSVGLDGRGMLLCEHGWRQAMVGTIALFAAEGERRHTRYVAATPEYGKQTFLARLEPELQRVKAASPRATDLGLADGAEDNWRCLNPRPAVQLIEFYHASGYLPAAAVAACPHISDQLQRQAWRQDRCHRLKHTPAAAQSLREDMKARPTAALNTTPRETRERAITDCSVHPHQMDSAAARTKHWPIGSGITEAACKTWVQQRLCRSGMRCKEKGAAVVLSLRALMLTPDRWHQCWDQLDRFGFPVAASSII